MHYKSITTKSCCIHKAVLLKKVTYCSSSSAKDAQLFTENIRKVAPVLKLQIIRIQCFIKELKIHIRCSFFMSGCFFCSSPSNQGTRLARTFSTCECSVQLQCLESNYFIVSITFHFKYSDFFIYSLIPNNQMLLTWKQPLNFIDLVRTQQVLFHITSAMCLVFFLPQTQNNCVQVATISLCPSQRREKSLLPSRMEGFCHFL